MKKAIILLAVLAFLACEEKYAPLYADLNLDETAIAEVVAYLQENKYEYKLKKDKLTLLVPKETKYEIRMVLTRNGLPKINGEYCCAHTDPSFTKSITELLQNTELRQTVERGLASNIETLSEIEKAIVSINKDTTATVKLKLHTYKVLDEWLIKNIQHFVATTVDELKAEQVSILDYEGNDLIAEYEARYKAEYEANPARKNVYSCGDGGC